MHHRGISRRKSFRLALAETLIGLWASWGWVGNALPSAHGPDVACATRAHEKSKTQVAKRKLAVSGPCVQSVSASWCKPLLWEPGRCPKIHTQEQEPWCATCEGISGRCPLAQGAPEILAEHTRMPWAAAGGRVRCAALRAPLLCTKPKRNSPVMCVPLALRAHPTFQIVLKFAACTRIRWRI